MNHKVVSQLREIHNAKQAEETKKTKIRKVIKHSVRVAGGAGIWYVATYIHDSPAMVGVMIVCVVIQSVIEEFVSEDK